MTLTDKQMTKAPFPWFGDGTITADAQGAIWRHTSNGKPLPTPRRIDLPDQSKGYRNAVLPNDGRWRTFKAHRLMWEWHNGPIPDGFQIDHINGVKDDNRLEEHGWTVHEWFTAGFLSGGMGNVNQGDGTHQQHRERLWASPHCLNPDPDPPAHEQLDMWGER